MKWFRWRERDDSSESTEDVQVVRSDNFQTRIVVTRSALDDPSESEENHADPSFDQQTSGEDTDYTGSDKEFLLIRRTLMYAISSTCFFVIFLIIFSVGFAKDLFWAKPEDANRRPNALSNRTRSEKEEYSEHVYEYLTTVTVNGAEAFSDPISPESQALVWMQYDDPLKLDPIEVENHYRINQRFALLTLWFQSDYDWFVQKNWLSEDECTWEGIFCVTAFPPQTNESLTEIQNDVREGNELVSEINLARNNLQGNLPPNLYLLKNLTSLDLSGNQIKGPVPKSFGSLTWLEKLDLHDNLLSDDLSIDFSRMSSLTDLNLSNNRLEGTIPESLYLIPSITRIQVDNNAFTGEISDSIRNLVNLQIFTAGRNQLSGNIKAFSANSKLTTLILGDNKLTGVVNLEGISNLKYLVLENNYFSGPLPDLSSSLGITILRLGGNAFDNIFFPANYLELGNMTSFGLNDLYLTGEIPASIGTLTNLEILNLEGNSLNGIIPVSLMEVSTLEELTLHNNEISGPIPSEISSLTKLAVLSLSSNKLQSKVPDGIRRLTSLKYLSLGSNLLDGQILTSIETLSDLEVLDLADNGFSGTLPDSFWELTSLRRVLLANNYFSGQIPESIGSLLQLHVLNVASNSFRGRIPESITALTDLTVLDFSFNFFGGPIPNNIGDLVNLRELLLGTNYDTTQPTFGLDGTIPVSIAKMLKLEKLEINRNRISGFLPSRHKFLKSIQLYDVSENQKLGGTIPKGFSNMTRLNGLNIFGTNIDGIVPIDLCERNTTIRVDCVGPTTMNCSCCVCYQ